MAETETTEKVSFFKKHKKPIIVLGAIAVIAAIAIPAVNSYLQKQSEAETPVYEFIRTVTLEKGSLEDVVTATGTVASGNTSTVTYSGAGYSIPKVKEVNVSVGDFVNEGDVIVTLDTESIQKSIDDALELQDKSRDKAKKAYDDAIEAYDDANDAYEDYEDDYYDAKREYKNALADYNSAKNSVAPFQSDYDSAYAKQENLGRELNRAFDEYMDAQSKLATATTNFTSTSEALIAEPENQTLIDAKNNAEIALANAQTDFNAKEQTYQNADNAFNKAKTSAEQAAGILMEAKSRCNYAVYEATYNAKKQIYDGYDKGFDQLESALKSAEKMRDNAKEAYEDSLESSDTLDDLYEELEKCSLKAETSGKVTALNVSVGDTPAGIIASIQDTDSLIIKISIAEADINDVALGMDCHITSDATEGEINGRLTQIDPVSSMGGVFGAEVTVLDENTGLLVGMNASVDIVLSSTDDCFTVPYDAVGTDEKGDFIYRSTGGEGVDMTFEQVYVTTGEQNDYYIEISGNDLHEGDIIRASADLTVGIESTEEQDAYAAMMNGMGGMSMGMGHMGGEPPKGMPGMGG